MLFQQWLTEDLYSCWKSLQQSPPLLLLGNLLWVKGPVGSSILAPTPGFPLQNLVLLPTWRSHQNHTYSLGCMWGLGSLLPEMYKYNHVSIPSPRLLSANWEPSPWPSGRGRRTGIIVTHFLALSCTHLHTFMHAFKPSLGSMKVKGEGCKAELESRSSSTLNSLFVAAGIKKFSWDPRSTYTGHQQRYIWFSWLCSHTKISTWSGKFHLLINSTNCYRITFFFYLLLAHFKEKVEKTTILIEREFQISSSFMYLVIILAT